MKILLILLLIVNIINPKIAWKIGEGWKYKNVEPSDAYLYYTRAVSIIILLFMLVVLCIGD